MSASFTLLEEQAHCSQHAFYMNGCEDCQCAEDYKDHSTKLEKNFSKGVVTIGTHPLVIEPQNPSPKAQLITQQMARMLAVFFSGAAKSAAVAAGKKAKEFTKIETTDEEKIALAAYLAIQWDEIVDSMTTSLMAAYLVGAEEALQQLGMVSQDINDAASKAAVEYANNRAAEMIGKKYVDEKLVESPSAKYVIANTTKDDLLDVVTQASQDDLSITEMMERIKMAGTFSDLRSQFIAKNERAVAQSVGHISMWKASGRIKLVNVVLSDAHNVYDLCDEHSSNGPYTLENCPIIPAHPYCACKVQVIELMV